MVPPHPLKKVQKAALSAVTVDGAETMKKLALST
jgi:hypothetical protein